VNVDAELARLLASRSGLEGYPITYADDAVEAFLFARLNKGGVQEIGAKALASAAMRVLLQNEEKQAGLENCVFLAGPPSVFKSSIVEELASCLGFTVEAQKRKQQQQNQPGGGYIYYNFLSNPRAAFGPQAQTQLLAQLKEAKEWAEKQPGRVAVVVFDEIHSPLTSSGQKRETFQQNMLLPILNNQPGFKANQLLFVLLANLLDKEIADEFGKDTDAERATKLEKFKKLEKACSTALKLEGAVESRLVTCVVCPPPTVELFRRLLADRLVLRVQLFASKGGEFTPWKSFSATDIHDLLDAALWGYQAVLGFRNVMLALDPKVDELLADGGKEARKSGSAFSKLKLGLDNGQIVLSAISKEGRRVELARQGEFDSYCLLSVSCLTPVGPRVSACAVAPMCSCGCCLPYFFFSCSPCVFMAALLGGVNVAAQSVAPNNSQWGGGS
jgi:hypothetical protein